MEPAKFGPSVDGWIEAGALQGVNARGCFFSMLWERELWEAAAHACGDCCRCHDSAGQGARDGFVGRGRWSARTGHLSEGEVEVRYVRGRGGLGGVARMIVDSSI